MSSSTGWRTIVIDKKTELSYSTGTLLVEEDDGTSRNIPLFDVRSIIVRSLQVKMTAYLLNELHKRKISVIFCNEKSSPYGEIVGYYNHHAAPARLFEQIRWKKEVRRQVWTQIVRQKITVQCLLLGTLHHAEAQEKLEPHAVNVAVGDKTNREGQAARLYFHALFGIDFRRQRGDSPINSPLNYGYAILCSMVTRALTAHGYHPSLGIAHRGATNPFNLSYDLMEPFRPFVDRIVCRNGAAPLEKEYKNQLIGVSGDIVRYKNRQMPLATAVDAWILDITKVLSGRSGTIGEIRFK